MKMRVGGIGLRIAAAALAVAGLATAILALGVVIVGSQAFTELMTAHGVSVESSHSMFDDAVGRVVLLAVAAALVATAILAMVLGRHLASPLQRIGASARRIAEGDYGERIPRSGPEEIVGLADSFNQMAAALEEQERMRREFIANAAHELRTPLTNLKGYLEALRDGVIPADRAAYESLLEEAERLVRLAQSLDALAEADAEPRRPPVVVDIDLVPLIRSAVELAQPAMRTRDLAAAVDLPPELRVRGDPDKLTQVIANLLQNASRYAPVGGRVTITGEQRPSDVLVTVTNTGAAIPAQDVPHLFERFYRVDKSRDPARGGAGIGLAIVRQIVEAAGGRVGVESTGGLTRFWFSLPT